MNQRCVSLNIIANALTIFLGDKRILNFILLQPTAQPLIHNRQRVVRQKSGIDYVTNVIVVGSAVHMQEVDGRIKTPFPAEWSG